MLINNNVQAIAGAYAVQQNRTAAPRRTERVSLASEVVFSPEGQSFASLLQKLRKNADRDQIRSERVDSLKEQVAAGDYDVSNENIAASMLAGF